MSIEALATIVDLPDDAVLEHGISAIVYLDQDGDQAYKYGTFGDTTYAALIGLLEMVKTDLLHMARDS